MFFFEAAEPEPDQAACDDEKRGGEPECGGCCEDEREEDSRGQVDDARLAQLEDGIEDENADARAYACKGVLYDQRILKVAEACGDDRDDDDAREDDAECRDDAARCPFEPAADECGGVDGDDARRALSDGEIIVEFFVCRPVLAFDDFALEYGEHGVAAAERADADFCKGQEQVKVDIHKA